MKQLKKSTMKSNPNALKAASEGLLKGKGPKREQEVVYIFKDSKNLIQHLAVANGTTVNIELNKLLDEILELKKEEVEKARIKRKKIEDLLSE